MIQHNEFFAISQIKKKAEHWNNISTTILTLKQLGPTPLLEKMTSLICNTLRIFLKN